MLELIKERWNNLPAADRRTVAILLLPALVLITFSLLGLMSLGGTRHHLDQATVESKRLTIELEPRLMEKSEYLELLHKDNQLLAQSKEMEDALKKRAPISATPREPNKLLSNRMTGDGKTLLARVHEGLSSPDPKIISLFLWLFCLLCGIAALAPVCRKLGFTFGEHPLAGTGQGLNGPPQACGPIKRGSLPDPSDILLDEERPALSCGPDGRRTGEPDWHSLMRSVDPWSGHSWGNFKLADSTSLAELAERVLATADRQSHPSMRFYLSTVLKAHMFLQDKVVSSPGKNIPHVRFNNSLLRLYYEFSFRHGVDFETDSGNVILEILKLLDEHGDCPSIASLANDPESRLNGRSHAVLRKVPLWRHSLNVANRVTGRCMYQGEPLSQLLITSLAHDLGKMPHLSKSEREPHAQASVRELNKISCFDNLSYAGDIRKAIREHHDGCPSSPLGKKLSDADRLARRFELVADSFFEHDKWEIGCSEDETPEPTIKSICLSIYPYFMHFTELESLRDSLTAYNDSVVLVKDLERILRQPPFLFNDAFRVGAAIADIAGATLRAKDRLYEVK